MYFWCESGEDGTRMRMMSEADVRVRLAAIIRQGEGATFLREVPQSDRGCWRCVPEDAVLIIKGEIVVPEPKERVTEYVLS